MTNCLLVEQHGGLVLKLDKGRLGIGCDSTSPDVP